MQKPFIKYTYSNNVQYKSNKRKIVIRLWLDSLFNLIDETSTIFEKRGNVKQIHEKFRYDLHINLITALAD